MTNHGSHPQRRRRIAGGLTALAVVAAGLTAAPAAHAAPEPTASASPAAIDRYGTSTVTLTLDGETSLQSTPTDLVLVLDESGSISSSNFTRLKNFADDIVEAVAADGLFEHGGTVGIVAFGTGARVVLTPSSSESLVRNVILGLSQRGGSTCLACGLDTTNSLLGLDDPERNEAVIVVTDGNANVRSGDTALSAQILQARAGVFAVGVGAGVSQATLELVASGDGSTNTFPVDGFEALESLLETLVAAVAVPAATNPSVTVTLAPDWALAPGSVSATLGASVSGETTNGFVVSRDTLGDESLVITYEVEHLGATCGPLPVNAAVDYSDDEGAQVAFPEVTVDVTCVAPVADAGPDRTVDEGSTVLLDGTGSHDPDGTLTAHAWSGSDSSIGTLVDAGSASTSYVGVDDGTDSVTLTVTDDDGLSGEDEVQVTVTNVAPSLSLTSCPATPSPVGTDVVFGGVFTDPGTRDTHVMSVDWGDGTVTTAAPTTSPVGGTHRYAEAGRYDITVTVTDDDGGADTQVCGSVVAYDPTAGFVTGGGWIDSPAGAYPADPDASGKANVGFVAKYKKGAHVPTGNATFQLGAAGLKFKASDFEWLLVAGSMAQAKGTGTVNGASGYEFQLTATDGRPDRLRLRIWQAADGTVVYDNQMGAGDAADPTTALSGGQVVVHQR